MARVRMPGCPDRETGVQCPASLAWAPCVSGLPPRSTWAGATSGNARARRLRRGRCETEARCGCAARGPWQMKAECRHGTQRSLRRPDHRRRRLRHRHGVPPGARVPAQARGHPRAPRRDRRDLGPVSLPRRALRLGHDDLRLPLAPLDRGARAGRRPVDSGLRHADGARLRRGRTDPLRAAQHRGRLVQCATALDRHGGGRGQWPDAPVQLRLSGGGHGLFQPRPGPSAGLCGRA